MSSPNIPEMRRRPDSGRSHSRNENVLRLEPLPFPALFLRCSQNRLTSWGKCPMFDPLEVRDWAKRFYPFDCVLNQYCSLNAN